MRVAVIGVGHVGLVTAATLAQQGHEVTGLDHDHDKIETILAGHMPFFEPELEGLVAEQLASGRLRFTHQPAEAMAGAEFAFICVGTPARPDGEANLLAIEKAAEAAAQHADRDFILVQKSTVPVSTGDRLQSLIGGTSQHRFFIVSNPEFLREGSAVADSLNPTRILVGADDEAVHARMRELYAPLIKDGVAYFATDIKTAELAKHASNAFLALKISYANALARICDLSGADVVSIADIMGSDPRIGRDFLNAGLGYGGFCFPKDIAAFRAVASQLGYEFGLLDEVVKINDDALRAAFAKIKDVLWNLEDKKVALFGLSFKPGTDDIRDSPALNLARDLISAGVTVSGFDPEAGPAAAAQVKGLEVCDDPYQAAERADCIVICTEWPEFIGLDWGRIKGICTRPIIVDGRNLLDSQAPEIAGFTYIPTGRPSINL